MDDELLLLNKAYVELLGEVFGSSEDFFAFPVSGAHFDRCRKRVELKYGIAGNPELLASWQAILALNSPKFKSV